jgi:quercetin dioxygenase-like cupin family protein
MNAFALSRPLVPALALVALLFAAPVALAPRALAADPAPRADVPPVNSTGAKPGGVHARLIVETPLMDAPGKKLTMVRVTFDPGGAMAPHEHGGTVLVYVVLGTLRSQIGDRPARIYHTGESWVELPGVHHAVCENASATDPAELVATLVADATPTGEAEGAPADTLAPSGRHHD